MAAQTWFATSPQLPISGPGPSFAVFTTPDVVIDDRQVIFVLDLGGEQIRAAGLPLTVGATSRGEHP
jgi:hypothetical protein